MTGEMLDLVMEALCGNPADGGQGPPSYAEERIARLAEWVGPWRPDKKLLGMRCLFRYLRYSSMG